MTYDVEIELDGDKHVVEVDEDEYLLDAAERAGLELPHSCRTGSCTSCVARVREGEFEQPTAMGLDPGQKQDGYILPCAAKPKTDAEVVADVQDELFEIDI